MFPKWRGHYIDYKRLKKLLKKTSSSAGVDSEAFLTELQRYVDAVNAFVTEQQRLIAQENRDIAEARKHTAASDQGARRELQSRAQAVWSLTTELTQFAETNYTTVYKAIKKHDKLTRRHLQAAVLKLTEAQPFMSFWFSSGSGATTSSANGSAPLSAQSSNRRNGAVPLLVDALYEPREMLELNGYQASTSDKEGSSDDAVSLAVRLPRLPITSTTSDPAMTAYENALPELMEFDSLLDKCLSYASEALALLSPELSDDGQGMRGRLDGAEQALAELRTEVVHAITAHGSDPVALQALLLKARLRLFPTLVRPLLAELGTTASPEAASSMEHLLQLHALCLGQYAAESLADGSVSIDRSLAAAISGALSQLPSTSADDRRQSAALSGDANYGLSPLARYSMSLGGGPAMSPASTSIGSFSYVAAGGSSGLWSPLGADPYASRDYRASFSYSTDASGAVDIGSSSLSALLLSAIGLASDGDSAGSLGPSSSKLGGGGGGGGGGSSDEWTAPWVLSRLWRTWRPAMFDWLPDYKLLKHLPRDIAAGVTIGVMLIPQGLAYAQLAGLPPYHGIYTGFPAVLYAIFGTSRQGAIGPQSIPCLLIASSVSSLVPAVHGEAYVESVMSITLLCGLLMLGMGWLQLGFVVRFISRPVLGGFAAGSAVLTSEWEIASARRLICILL